MVAVHLGMSTSTPGLDALYLASACLEAEQAKPDGKPPEMLLYFRKVGPSWASCKMQCFVELLSITLRNHERPSPKQRNPNLISTSSTVLQVDCEWSLRPEIGKKVSFTAPWPGGRKEAKRLGWCCVPRYT